MGGATIYIYIYIYIYISVCVCVQIWSLKFGMQSGQRFRRGCEGGSDDA